MRLSFSWKTHMAHLAMQDELRLEELTLMWGHPGLTFWNCRLFYLLFFFTKKGSKFVRLKHGDLNKIIAVLAKPNWKYRGQPSKNGLYFESVAHHLNLVPFKYKKNILEFITLCFIWLHRMQIHANWGQMSL